MSTITVRLDGDNDELMFALKIIQSIIDKNDAEKKQWESERKQRRKKKTVDELIQEIEDDIKCEMDTITDSNIEIENLEMKRAELEKYDKRQEQTDAIAKDVKAIKKRRKVKTDTELIPESN